jgi:hypothetical protein
MNEKIAFIQLGHYSINGNMHAISKGFMQSGKQFYGWPSCRVLYVKKSQQVKFGGLNNIIPLQDIC